MTISKIKLAWKYLTGGMGSVTDYLLDVLNAALAKIDPEKRETIQAVLNVAQKVLATLTACQWLCPTKWQTAYNKTVTAVLTVTVSLGDLVLTVDELLTIQNDFNAAVVSWKSDDDETCVELKG